MAITIYQFFDAAKRMRKDGIAQRMSGDDTTFQLNKNGDLTAHEWKTYTTRGKVYNETNRKLRQALYDGLTQRLGTLEKLPKPIRDQMKLGDFQAKNGKVQSDCPLTLRRIEAIQKIVDAADMKIEVDAKENPPEMGNPSNFGTAIMARRKDVLALCRKLLPETIPDETVPLSAADMDWYVSILPTAISEYLDDNPAARQILQNEQDIVVALEKILADAPELRNRIAESLLAQTHSLLIQRAEEEIKATLLPLAKDLPDLDDVEVNTAAFDETYGEIEFTANDTAATIKAQIDALKNAELANRRAVLAEIRKSKTLKKNRTLRNVLIRESLVNPGLKPGDLEDAFALVHGFNLKPADKSEESAVKVFADIAKKVLAKKEKGEAYLKVVALTLAHAHAKEIAAIVDILPDRSRVAFSERYIHESLFEDDLEDEEKSAAEDFFKTIAETMTYKLKKEA